MRAVDLIGKTRHGEPLTGTELRWLVDGYVAGEVTEGQMAAWAMAVCLRGLTPQETADLTLAMAASGEQLSWPELPGRTVDKHSTGGVGDKTTLVLAPLVAAAGVPLVKMSGRALGHTGGTLDKLEAIPGLTTDLARPRLLAQLQRVGCVVARQTALLAPADAQLYALRDVTGTVDSLPLIVSSIMSKKIAAGADAIVLDVKVGSGAFMADEAQARALAAAMVAIGRQLGRETVAVLSRMDEPLGAAVGNAIEVNEAAAALRGEGPADLQELTLALGAEVLLLARAAPDATAARLRLEQVLAAGTAYERFLAMIQAQGGDAAAVARGLPLAPKTASVLAPRSGFVLGPDARRVGEAVMALGAGRRRQEDGVDPSVGVTVGKKTGDKVAAGEVLAQVFARTEADAAACARSLDAAYRVTDRRPPDRPLLLGRLAAPGNLPDPA